MGYSVSDYQFFILWAIECGCGVEALVGMVIRHLNLIAYTHFTPNPDLQPDHTSNHTHRHRALNSSLGDDSQSILP
jgi:hypothetical protein